MATNNEPKIAELLDERHIPTPQEAAELLSIAADYLKAREPMPDALADYLAHAFRRAASTPQHDDSRNSGEGKAVEDERIARLIEGLCLKRDTCGRPRKEIEKTKDVIVKVASTIGLTKTSTPKDVKPLLEAMGSNGEKKAQVKFDSRRASMSEGEAISEIAKASGLNERTARNRFKEIKAEIEAASEQLDEIKKNNGLTSLIRKR